MNHYQDQAAAAIKRKDYKAALQHYNKAIGRAESAKLYDARAACHVKLKDLPSALKDAKKCIQIAKTDPVGYLRAGMILTTMDKKSVALEVMAHGLRKVKHAGQSYETLQSTHNTLMQEINPVKSVDPMTLLPRELAISILEQLDFKQLMNVCSVSKAWNNLVTSMSDLWEHLDFSRASPHVKFRVKHAFVLHAIKIAGRKIRHATLNNMANFEDALSQLVQRCPLESLTLLAVPRLPNNLAQLLQRASHLRSIRFPMDEEQTFTMIRQLFNVLDHQLEDVSCRMSRTSSLARILDDLRLPRLRSLNMFCQFGTAHSLQNMPVLQSLTLRPPGVVNGTPMDLYDLTPLQRLQQFDVVCGQLQFCYMKLPASLKTLKVKCWQTSVDQIYLYDAAGWPVLALPKLEELDLSMAIPTGLEVVSRSLSEAHSTHLRRLIVRPLRLQDEGNPQLFESFAALPQLKELEHIGLPDAYDWTDELVPIMVKRFPKLASMDFTTTDITGVGVQAAMGAPHLAELTLDDCPKLGHDAVQWARSKGIRVHNRKAEAMRYERTVRV